MMLIVTRWQHISMVIILEYDDLTKETLIVMRHSHAVRLASHHYKNNKSKQ